MKRYSDISRQLTKPVKVDESYTKYDRESFIRGDLIKVGDIVEHNGRRAEVLDIGANYATLIRGGETFRSWITEIRVIQNSSLKSPPTIEGDTLSFKGYTTKNFPRSLSEELISKYSNEDNFAFYNCIISCDYLLGATSNSLIEHFYKYNNDLNRATRYLSRLGIEIPQRMVTVGEALQLIKEHKEMI
jgi:hypothetical protein